MSIGEFATGEASLAEQPLETTSKKPPPKRLITAKPEQRAIGTTSRGDSARMARAPPCCEGGWDTAPEAMHLHEK